MGYTMFGPILNIFQAIGDDMLDGEVDSTGLTCRCIFSSHQESMSDSGVSYSLSV